MQCRRVKLGEGRAPGFGDTWAQDLGPQVCLGCQPLSRVSSADSARLARTLKPTSLFPLNRWPVVVKTRLGHPSRVSGTCLATPACRQNACTLSMNLSLKFQIVPPNGSAVEGLGVCLLPQACLLPALAPRGRGQPGMLCSGRCWVGRSEGSLAHHPATALTCLCPSTTAGPAARSSAASAPPGTPPSPSSASRRRCACASPATSS